MVACSAAAAAAAPEGPAPEPQEAPGFAPGHWALGDWQLQPQWLVAMGHNSNLRQQPHGVESPFLAVFPGLTLQRPQGSERLAFTWRSEATHFGDSPLDSTLNTELSADGLLQLGERSALAWRGAWQVWHDSVTQSDPNQPAAPPDRYHAQALGVVWRVDPEPGADGLGWRLEAEPTWSRKRYRTRREVTTLADADVQDLSARVLRAVAPERRLGLELRASRLRYPGNYQSLDHHDAFGWAVLQWEPGEWSGRARLGAQQRSFDRLRPRQRLLNGDGELQWQATPDRLLELGWQRGASDVPGDGADAVVARRLSVAWTERWGPARATLTWSRIGSAYLNGFQPRDDRLQSVDLAWRMDLARQWQVGVNLGWMQRRSTLQGFDFERALNSLVLSAAL